MISRLDANGACRSSQDVMGKMIEQGAPHREILLGE
jgi:hypothetical protein